MSKKEAAEAIKKEVAEEAEAKKAEETPKSIQEMLKDLDGAPGKEQIETWKAEFGEVFVSGFSEEELFVWRPILRGEFVKLQAHLADQQLSAFDEQELTCDVCLLWPIVDWEKAKAGTASTLSEQIMHNSNFLAPQVAAQLVAKL